MTRDQMLEEIALREELARREAERWGLAERIALIRENKERTLRGEVPLPKPWTMRGESGIPIETREKLERIRERAQVMFQGLRNEHASAIVEFDDPTLKHSGTDPEEIGEIKALAPDTPHIVVKFVSPEGDN